METKGHAVKVLLDYLRLHHADKYIEWLNNLPLQSKNIFQNLIATDKWYSLHEAVIEPTVILSRLLNTSMSDLAWNIGKYNADVTLTGIYRIYVKLGTPRHIIDRASRIFSAFYNPSEMVVASHKANEVVLHITKFPAPHLVVDNNIGGWIERAIEISGSKDVKVKIPRSLTRGNPVTEFVVTWK